MVVMENLIKCGVRVHGGTGNGTLIRKKRLLDFVVNIGPCSRLLQPHLRKIDRNKKNLSSKRAWST